MPELRGQEAIDWAAQRGLPLNADAGPEGEARWDVSVEEARAIAATRPLRIWVRTDEVTRDRIEELRGQAGLSKDERQQAICERALAGDQAAWEECSRILGQSRAQG